MKTREACGNCDPDRRPSYKNPGGELKEKLKKKGRESATKEN